MDELQLNIERNYDVLASGLKRGPNTVYQKLNEIALFVGSRHGVDLQIHFPIPSKISEPAAYGTENVGIEIDKFRKSFPISR